MIKILLVDDDDAINYFHKLMLSESSLDCEITVKGNGLEAIQFINTAIEKQLPHPDLILLDINMPKMNGWEFLEAYEKLVSQSNKNLLIIMLTTSENPDDRNRAKKTALLSDFLIKPLTPKMINGIQKKYFSQS